MSKVQYYISDKATTLTGRKECVGYKNRIRRRTEERVWVGEGQFVGTFFITEDRPCWWQSSLSDARKTAGSVNNKRRLVAVDCDDCCCAIQYSSLWTVLVLSA